MSETPCSIRSVVAAPQQSLRTSAVRCVLTCDPSPDAVRVTRDRLQEVERRGAMLPGTESEKQSKRVKVEQGQLFGI